MITLKVDTKEMKNTARKLEQFPKEIPKAINAALNRTATTVNKAIKKEVTSKYEIKSGEVAGTLNIKKSSATSLSIMVVSKGKILGLDHFPSNINSVFKGSKNKNIWVKVKKKSKKIINTSPGAFVNTLGSTMHILKRKGPSKYPLEKLNTLSIPQMISNVEVSEKIQEKANETLQKRIEHEVNYRLEKLGK